MQLITHLLGGKVDKGTSGEYGKAFFYKEKEHPLLKNVPEQSQVWMSHFDEVSRLPKDFESLDTLTSA